MEFLVGDENGQIKLISRSAYRSQISNFEHEDIVEGNRSSSDGTSDATDSYTTTTLSPQIGKQDRSWAVTTLSWGPSVSQTDVCCEPVVERFSRLVPDSNRDLIVGRENGLVEGIQYPDGFVCPTGKRPIRSFLMPSKIVLAKPTTNNRVVCICEAGQGVIVNWDESIWLKDFVGQSNCQKVIRSDDSGKSLDNLYPSFLNAEFTPIDLKFRHGRQQKSDGSLPMKPQLRPSVPSYDVDTKKECRPLWLEAAFSLPSPVTCASLSTLCPDKLLFTGINNLPKVVDLKSLTICFSGRNRDPDCLMLTDPVENVAVVYLESFGQSVFAVGTRKGRLQIYDSKAQSKPVLEVQVCPPGTSVAALVAEPCVELKHAFNHCAIDNSQLEKDPRTPKKVETCILRQNLTRNLARGESATQKLIVTDNVGECFAYNITGVRKSKSELYNQPEKLPNEDDSSVDATPLKKKRKRKPHEYGQYGRGEVSLSISPVSDIKFEVNICHNLKFATGAISTLSWSSMYPRTLIIGGSISRHAYIWNIVDKRDSRTVYLKNKITACLASYSILLLPHEENSGDSTIKKANKKEKNSLSDELNIETDDEVSESVSDIEDDSDAKSF